MNLKDLLINKNTPPELYWALVIERGLVQAGIWYIGEGTAEVVGVGTGIPWEKDEQLIEATDAALSSAIQKLPEDYPEPQKTVFGVASSWIKDGEISPENLGKIKHICTELSLTPVGFVVLSEAIAYLYKSEEGAPLNAIVLKPGVDVLELSIFKSGGLVGTTEVSRSVSLVDDVIEGLSRLGGASPLPTRFIVYDGKEGDLEDARQSLIQADWASGKISFLHTPQVEVLETEKKVLATALAGGAEIGNVSAVKQSNEEEPEDVIEEPKEPSEVNFETPPSAESMGFSVGGDVSAMKKEDVENVMPVAPPPVSVPPQPVAPAPVINNNQPVMAKPIAGYLAKSKELFHSFSKIFPKSQPGTTSKNKWIKFAPALLGVAALAVFILWWFVQSAIITIYVTPKRSEENIQVVFDSAGSYDSNIGIIPAKVLKDQVSGEKTKATTGTKLIGNKANGSVQIANGNSAAINLARGTILTSASGFKFVTVSEASISGQLLPGSPGTSTVDVTAYDIGSQYNLAKGEIFSVGNYSKALVAGTSTVDFSGGSSQQISAVGKEDQTGLEDELRNELTQSAKANLSGQVVSSEQIFINDLAEINVADATYNHKVGDQADNLKLSLTLDVVGLAADRAKLLEYAVSVLQGKTPEGYELTPDQIDFVFKFVSAEDGKYTYDVVVGGNFLPKVNTDQIKAKVLGKNTDSATEYLNTITGFERADVKLKITFPKPLKTIPRIANHISISVKPE